MSYKLKITLIILSVIFLSGYFSYPYVVKSIAELQFRKIEQRWNGIIDYESFDISGLTFKFKKLYVSGNDTLNSPLFAAKKISISFSLWNLITFNPLPASVVLDTAYINIYKTKTDRWNFSRTQIDSSISDSPKDYFPALVKRLFWVLDQPFENNLPEIIAAHVYLDFSFEGDHLKLYNLALISNSDSLRLSAISQKGFLISLDGKFNRDSLIFNLPNPEKLILPLPGKDNLMAKCDTGWCIIKKENEDQFKIAFNLTQFETQTSGLADDKIRIEKINNSILLNFKPDRKSLSVTNFSELSEMKIGADIVFSETNSLPELSLNVVIPPIDSKTFHSSVPTSFSGELSDFSFSGKLGYELNLSVKFDELDSLQLNGKVVTDKFRLINSGVDFDKLDTVFYQPVYDGLEIKREVMVGASNKFFTSYNQVPDYFIQSVVTSEDGLFFKHNGFNENAIRLSLIENLKTRKFKRGASTISMQFVKNVFLNRKKNLARKFQELLITWLLENQKPISKETMLEIYLNIIEFGPDIYGIGEAADYYFKKKPKDLTYEESLFLATIIPSPKKFFVRFDKDGQLKNSAVETMSFVASKMKQFDKIDPVKVDSLNFNRFSVSGIAKDLITPMNVVLSDSLNDD